AADNASMLPLDKTLIGVFVQQTIELFGICETQFDKPAVAHRVGIDLGRVGGERVIDLGHLSGDWRIDLARRLDRLDNRRFLALLDQLADFWQLDIDDVAELRLRIVGNADNGEVAVEPHPLMVPRVSNQAHRDFPPTASAAVIAGRNEWQPDDLRRP